MVIFGYWVRLGDLNVVFCKLLDHRSYEYIIMIKNIKGIQSKSALMGVNSVLLPTCSKAH